MQDRGELPVLMEPMLLGMRPRRELTELVFQLTQTSTSLQASLPETMVSSLADLVRSMNCYYSNLIEGHRTHPIDIELALRNQYDSDARKRDLQLEARAHISVQQWIDAGGLAALGECTEAGIKEIHRRFCELLPEDLLWATDPVTDHRARVEPGSLRKQDVKVGTHIAVSAGVLPRFLRRFEQVYGKLGNAESVLAAAAAHHRLLWMHPFLDGNGRVARLMSHAVLSSVLHTGAIWSVARGLARNVALYKNHLSNCDQPRRNDLDGRGTLSEEALSSFTRFFLTVCIDQVTFMTELVRPDQLSARILRWAEDETDRGVLPRRTGQLLQAILHRGELSRSEIETVIGTGARQARRVVSALMEQNILIADANRAPLRLAFPATVASRWMPGLFPDA